MMSTTADGRGHERRVIDVMGTNSGLHSLGHKTMIVFDDHAVLLGNQEPGRPILPERAFSLDANAGSRNRPLTPPARQFFFGSILREGGGEGRFGQVDQPMRVRRELGAWGSGAPR